MAGYDITIADPLASFLKGYQGMQEIGMNKSREDRAQQLHGLAMKQGAQGLEAGEVGIAGQRQAQEYNAQLQPYEVVQAQQRTAQAGTETIEAQQRQTQARRAQAYQAALGEVASKPGGATADDIAALNAEFPEYFAATQQGIANLSEGQRKAAAPVLAQGIAALRAGQTDLAVSLMEDYADAAEASGDAAGAASARASIDMVKSNPDAAITMMGVALTSIDPDAARAALGQGTGTTVQSQEAVGPYVLRLTMRDGTTVLQDTRTGRAIDPGQAQTAIDESLKAEREQRGGIKAEERGGTLGADIALGRAAAQETAIGAKTGAALGEAIAGANTDAQRAQSSIDLLDSILSDPNLEGITGRFDAMRPKWAQSQEGIDLLAKTEQVAGQAFLAAFESLKGGGSITEREGQAATAAMAQLDRAQSTEAYSGALRELRGILTTALERATRASGSAINTQPTGKTTYSKYGGAGN